MSDFAKPAICPICNEGKEFKPVMESGEFFLYECSDCRVQFFGGAKNPGAVWYENTSDYGIKALMAPKVRRGSQKRFLKRHNTFPPGVIALELGCGSGEFLHEIQKRGCRVYGVDFDRKGIELAKKYFNLGNVFAMGFDDFFRKTDLPKFDYIFFFEVIEHVDNPLEFIQQAKHLLKPGGNIILSTPSRERALVNWSRWDFPPHHVTRWNYQAILHMFRKIGLAAAFFCYDESYKMIAGSIDSRFRSGSASKAADASANNKRSNLFAWTLFVLAKVKYYILGGIPAFFVWIFSSMAGRHNGTMYFEFKEKQ